MNINKNEQESPDSQTTEWIDCKAAAEQFDCSVNTIKKWAREKKIQARQDAERKPYFVNVEALAEKLKNSPSVESCYKASAVEAEPSPVTHHDPPKSTPETQPDSPATKPEQAPSPRKQGPQARQSVAKEKEQRRTKKTRKPQLNSVLFQARQLPLADKVRLRNEITRLIDAA
ncbi:hypothetical protein [Roseibacillus ishigakijimensis]|uniref:Helix-turn-helix domain-containing protein n=1 Tax=Roseibacillus ishigakijimensis TaxID=454146 RepID=A0A934VNY8_9BACT|nr:hypothetical protein [Roseibacillus ishigakijimensis]MBK1835535.1 hypothetical protein [Roseibacillus ishigakijimensis]